MVNAAWLGFREELSHWRDAGREVEFWWRDDDACRLDPALTRLIALASKAKVPLALAAVPELAEPVAFEGLPPGIAVMQHGVDHRNRAVASEKKTEFSLSEPVDEALRRLESGRARLREVAGARMLSVLAPPWNRLPSTLVPLLVASGYRGLSTFGVRKVTNPAVGLTQVNTHVDIIDWKGNRGFCGEERALYQAIRNLAARRTGIADATEPIGWLTHHAVHDAASWEFLERLFEATCGVEGVHWLSARNLFGAEHGT